MKLIALKNHNYPNYQSREIGEEYDAPKSDAHVLVTVKLAKYSEFREEPAYETRDEVPVEVGNKKKKYQRKEMTPE